MPTAVTKEERERAVEEIKKVEGTDRDALGRVLSLPGWAAIPNHEVALFEALVEEKVNRHRLQSELDTLRKETEEIRISLTPREQSEGVVNAIRRLAQIARYFSGEYRNTDEHDKLEEWMIAAFGEERARSIEMQSMAKLVVGARIEIEQKETQMKEIAKMADCFGENAIQTLANIHSLATKEGT